MGFACVRSLRLKASTAIGVDGWAVDYVRLGEDGKPVEILFAIATNALWNRKDGCTPAFLPNASMNSPVCRFFR